MMLDPDLFEENPLVLISCKVNRRSLNSSRSKLEVTPTRSDESNGERGRLRRAINAKDCVWRLARRSCCAFYKDCLCEGKF